MNSNNKPAFKSEISPKPAIPPKPSKLLQLIKKPPKPVIPPRPSQTPQRILPKSFTIAPPPPIDLKEMKLQQEAKELYEIGMMMEQGTGGFEKNQDTGLAYIRRSAELGYSIAEYTLFLSYDEGLRNLAKDEKQAFFWCEKAAQKGHANAQLRLSYLYEKGVGTLLDIKSAFEWCQKAADNNNIVAINNLGTYHFRGVIVKENKKRALDYYQQAAALGNGQAAHNVGFLLERGYEGIKKDEAKALEYYRMAVTKQHQNAIPLVEKLEEKLCTGEELRQLAIKYEQGDGIEQNSAKAIEYYRKAALKNDAEAQYKLGLCYTFEYLSVKKDTAQAAQWYEQAAKLDHVIAQGVIAYCYSNNFGVINNYEVSFNWYKKAAEKNNSEGLSGLALCYLNGRGIPKDEKKAVECLIHNITINPSCCTLSYLTLGECFQAGNGVKKDIEKAGKLYRLANTEKSSNSLEWLLKENPENALVSYHFAMYHDNGQRNNRLIELGNKNPALLLALFAKDLDEAEPTFIRANAVDIMKRVIPYLDKNHTSIQQIIAKIGIYEGSQNQNQISHLFDQVNPEFLTSDEAFEAAVVIYNEQVIKSNSEHEIARQYLSQTPEKINLLYKNTYNFLKVAASRGHMPSKKFLLGLVCSRFPENIRPNALDFLNDKLEYPNTYSGFFDSFQNFVIKKKHGLHINPTEPSNITSIKKEEVPSFKSTRSFFENTNKASFSEAIEIEVQQILTQIQHEFRKIKPKLRESELFYLNHMIYNISLDITLNIAHLQEILKQADVAIKNSDKETADILNNIQEILKRNIELLCNPQKKSL